MKISERLRKKLKKITANVTFYRGYGVPDGVKFSWFAIDHTHGANPMLYSYDTMTDCLKKPIAAIYTYEIVSSTEGWLIGYE